MIKTYAHKKLEWIDLINPSKDEVRSIYEKYGLPPAVAESFLTPDLRAKAERYENCLFVVLYFPTRQKNLPGRETQEIDFCIGKDFLISCHSAEMPNIHEFSKLFEVNSIIGGKESVDHAGYLFYRLMKHLYSSLAAEIDMTTASLDEIENKIFSGMERDMVYALSELSRTTLDYKRSVRPHGPVLESLSVAAHNFIGENFAFYLKAIQSDAYAINENVTAMLDAVRELRDTTTALVSTRQNEVVQVLTVIAFIGLPVTVITALFQIDTVSRPIVGKPGDFWILLLLLAVVAFSLVAYFKHKKWL